MTDLAPNFGIQRPPQPASIVTAVTRDVDEQAALLRGWDQNYCQLSSGKFAGSITEVRLPGMHLFLEETLGELYQIGKLPDGLGAFGVPLKLNGPASFCGTPCEGTAMHVFSGDNAFEFHTPAGLLMAGVVLSEDQLFEAMSEKEQSLVRPGLADPHLRRTAAAHVQGLRQLITGVFDVLRGAPQLIDNIEIVNALKNALISNLAQAVLGDRVVHDAPLAASKRWQVVTAMREYVVANPDKPITVGELCLNLGVSRRTLQYCVQDVLGLSPAEFLRIVRLNGARRAIKSSRSVTEAATLWSFWHFGRFAHDYKQLFGELPSETFQRTNDGRARNK